MQDFLNQKIVLGICGGIAAYKSAYLVRELTRLGATVRVVMTEHAQQFITPMTLQALSGQEVRCDLFDSAAERGMGHIELARWADVLVIAPATANCLAKLAHGLADDLLSCLCLVTKAPVLVCPAMNQSMWAHPATCANVSLLKARGVVMVGPEEGSQACGDFGFGRMSEVSSIITALRLDSVHQLLNGRQVLITAGPTREEIDPVRYLSNQSSGKMGYALAEAAQRAGAEVILISGPSALQNPFAVEVHRVETCEEMKACVLAQLKPGMIFIAAAAVADYRVASTSERKLKKKDHPVLTLTLTPNPDILSEVVQSGKASYVVGFSAETEDVIPHALEKLHAKRVDMMVANKVGHGLGFDVDYHEVTLLTSTSQTTIACTHKIRLAGQIIAILATSLQNVAKFLTVDEAL